MYIGVIIVVLLVKCAYTVYTNMTQWWLVSLLHDYRNVYIWFIVYVCSEMLVVCSEMLVFLDVLVVKLECIQLFLYCIIHVAQCSKLNNLCPQRFNMPKCSAVHCVHVSMNFSMFIVNHCRYVSE